MLPRAGYPHPSGEDDPREQDITATRSRKAGVTGGTGRHQKGGAGNFLGTAAPNRERGRPLGTPGTAVRILLTRLASSSPTPRTTRSEPPWCTFALPHRRWPRGTRCDECVERPPRTGEGEISSPGSPPMGRLVLREKGTPMPLPPGSPAFGAIFIWRTSPTRPYRPSSPPLPLRAGRGTGGTRTSANARTPVYRSPSWQSWCRRSWSPRRSHRPPSWRGPSCSIRAVRTSFLKQLDSLAETFPLPPLSLLQMATAPLGRAFAAEVRNAGLYAHPSGSIPYPRLRQIIANKLESLRAPTEQAIPRPPKKGSPRAAPPPHLRAVEAVPMTPPSSPDAALLAAPTAAGTGGEKKPPSGKGTRRSDPGEKRGAGRDHPRGKKGAAEARETEGSEAVPPPKRGKGPQPCYICGEEGHRWGSCDKKKWTKGCGVCGSTAHLTFRCPQRYFPEASAQLRAVILRILEEAQKDGTSTATGGRGGPGTRADSEEGKTIGKRTTVRGEPSAPETGPSLLREVAQIAQPTSATLATPIGLRPRPPTQTCLPITEGSLTGRLWLSPALFFTFTLTLGLFLSPPTYPKNPLSNPHRHKQLPFCPQSFVRPGRANSKGPSGGCPTEIPLYRPLFRSYRPSGGSLEAPAHSADQCNEFLGPKPS